MQAWTLRKETHMRFWLLIGALNGALAVALGAVGAHALGPATPDVTRSVFETAAHYHLIHSLALIGVAAIAPHLPGISSRRIVHAAGAAFTTGIVFFCGGLYAFSGLDMSFGARLAPFGGTLLIVGWFMLAAAALANRSHKP